MKRIRWGIAAVSSLVLFAGIMALGQKTSVETVKNQAGGAASGTDTVTVTGRVIAVNNREGALSLIALVTKEGTAYSIKIDETGRKMAEVPRSETVEASGKLVEEIIGQGDMAHKRRTLTVAKFSVAKPAPKAEALPESEVPLKTEPASPPEK